MRCAGYVVFFVIEIHFVLRILCLFGIFLCSTGKPGKPFILCNKFRYFHIKGLDDAMTLLIRGIISMRCQWKDECLIYTCTCMYLTEGLIWRKCMSNKFNIDLNSAGYSKNFFSNTLFEFKAISDYQVHW